MASLVSLALGWLFVGIGLLAIAKGVGPLRTAVRLRPGASAIGMAEGQATVKGVARVRDDPLSSPLTDEDVLVYEYGVSLDTDGDWEWVMGERDAVPFLVEDESGRAVVAVDGLEIDLTPETELYEGSDDLPATYRERFDALTTAGDDTAASVDPAVAGERFATDRWVRVDRQTLRPGDDVLVTGTVDRTDGAAGCRLTDARLTHPAPRSAIRRLLGRGVLRTAVGLACVALALTAFAVVP